MKKISKLGWFSLTIIVAAGLGTYIAHDNHADASSVLHMPAHVRQAFNIKRALHNTNPDASIVRNKRANHLKAILKRKGYHRNQIKAIVATINFRTTNFKPRGSKGYFKFSKTSAYVRYAKRQHKTINDIVTQLQFLTKVQPRTMKRFNNAEHQSAESLFNILYYGVLHGSHISVANRDYIIDKL